MKIEASTVSLSSMHVASVREEVRQTVRAWVGSQPPEADGGGTSSSVVALSAAARDAAERALAGSAPPPASTHRVDGKDASDADPILGLIRLVIEMLTGVPVRTLSRDDLEAAAADAPQPSPQAAQPPAPDIGIAVDTHVHREEMEQTSFAAEGVIRTADGKQISFNLSLAMARSHVEETDLSIRAGTAAPRDPLVLNFGGSAAQLTGGRFKFDLDGDGTQEDMPTLAGNSGFLAIDLNGNGKVDSGKELFGPGTGNGFAELAQYDSDGNGWIDENDPVFSQLGIWRPGSDLQSLKERNVGALFTGNVATPFELRDDSQDTLGQVRGSGVYLTEDGKAGSLQQVDLMI